MDDTTLRTMRQMAWERAKGELRAGLATFWADIDSHEQAKKEIDRFIEKIEGDGLME